MTQKAPFWHRVDEKYLVHKGRYISPADVEASSRARPVRESGVKVLYRSLKEAGWSKEKGLRVKELEVGADGRQRYGCIDGMHRIEAVRRLVKEEEAELSNYPEEDRESMRIWGRLEVLASVYHKDLPHRAEVQLAVEANRCTSVMVRMTLFDMLSAMAEVRKALLEDHNAGIDRELTPRAGGPRKKKVPDRWENPWDVPKELVTSTFVGEGPGSYAKTTVGTYCSLLYRFDKCPLSWSELRRTCSVSDTENAINQNSLYNPEFAQEHSDGVKYWILRRLRSEARRSKRGCLNKQKAKKLMSLQVCLLREVEKLATIFDTSLAEFKWGSVELEKQLKDGLENGEYDKYIPEEKEERKALNEKKGTLLEPFDQMVETYHDDGRDALERFWRDAQEAEERANNARPGAGDDGEQGRGESVDGERESEEGGGSSGNESVRDESGDGGRDGSGDGGSRSGSAPGTATARTGARKRSLPMPQNIDSRKRQNTGPAPGETPSWISRGKGMRLYGQSFEAFLESEVFEEIKSTVDLILTDPPYNLDKTVDHDRITESQMKRFAEGACELLRPGGNLVLFCSWQQLLTWTKHLQNAAFLVCPVPLHVIKVRNVNMRSNFFQNIVDYRIFAIAKVSRAGDKRVWLRWKGTKYTKGGGPDFPAHTNCLTYKASPNESKLMKKGPNDQMTPWRSEEKSLNLIRELMVRFSSPNSTVVDLFAGTFTTALAAGEIGRSYVGCERDVELFEAATARVKEHEETRWTARGSATSGGEAEEEGSSTSSKMDQS